MRPHCVAVNSGPVSAVYRTLKAGADVGSECSLTCFARCVCQAYGCSCLLRKERYISHKRRERCSLCTFATTNISGHHHTILHLASNNSSLRSTSTTQLQLAAVPPLVPAVVHVAENDSVPPPFQCFKIAGSWLRHHLCAFCLLSSVRLPDSCMTTALPSSFTTMLSSFSGVPSPRFGVRTSGHDLHRFIHMAIHACTRTRFRGRDVCRKLPHCVQL